MTCERCTDLCQDVPIVTPGGLEKAIRVIGGNLRDGTLVEVVDPPNTSIIGRTPFAELLHSPPWPDIIRFDFRCAHCGEPFRLECETYHGSGGSWSHGRSRSLSKA